MSDMWYQGFLVFSDYKFEHIILLSAVIISEFLTLSFYFPAHHLPKAVCVCKENRRVCSTHMRELDTIIPRHLKLLLLPKQIALL